MESNANCMELMESIFENDLLLANIFSCLDLDTVKIVRLVNTKWKSVAWKVFSEISQVHIHLQLVLGTDLENASLQLDLNSQPFITLDLGQDINTALNDQLAPFKNFKLQFTMYQTTLGSDRRIDLVYSRLNQLIRHLWRPSGSLIHSLPMLLSSKVDNVSRDLLASIIEACNAFSYVEVKPIRYVLLNTYDLPKMTCHTLRVNYATFRVGNLSNSLSNFVNTKKIVFEDVTLVNLDSIVRAISENGEQFGKLEEIDVAIKFNFDKLQALAELRGLKRLQIQMSAAIVAKNTIPALQECIARHAPALEFLHLEFTRCNATAGLSFETMEFIKLRRLCLKANLTFVKVGGQEVDAFYLNEAIENGTFRKVFPKLKKIEVAEPPDTSHPILKINNISELGVKYGIQVMYNGVCRT